MKKTVLLCYYCNNVLEYQAISKGDEVMFEVSPCSDCLRREYESGVFKGYERGCEDTEAKNI
jgi:hypothetical protein